MKFLEDKSGTVNDLHFLKKRKGHFIKLGQIEAETINERIKTKHIPPAISIEE
jgi:hypothetical protein